MVLVSSAACAGAAALGPLTLVGREAPPIRAIGWANALAAGLMLGAAYLLMTAGLRFDPLHGAMGALLGIGCVWASHFASGTDELDLNRLDAPGELYGYQVMLVTTLHSAAEGVAIGAAMGVGLPFGVFVAVALAVHNVPEATVLSAVLKSRGGSSIGSAALAVISDLSQVVLAVGTFAVVSAAPAVLPWAIGFAFGSLIYLVMAELLPECYRQAGRTPMAVVTLLAMGIVVLLGGFVS